MELTQEQLIAELRKAGVELSTGGLLPEETLNAFIDLTVEQSEFLKMINVQRDIRTTRHLDSIVAQSRTLQKHVEGTPGTNIIGLTHARRSLTPVFVDLLYNISLEWLYQNIEKEGAENSVDQAIAKQFRSDLVDLCWNGDKAAGAGDDQDFLIVCDGYIVRMAADVNTHEYDRGESTDWLKTVFPGVLKELPEKYRQDKNELAFFVGSDVDLEYREQLGNRETNLGDNFIQNAPPVYYGGIQVQSVPGVPFGTVTLTKKQNLAVGFGWEMRHFRELKPRAGNIEHTIYAHVDANYAASDLIAYCQ